jgi:uncharacterized protein YdiU (UPF0061 family)
MRLLDARVPPHNLDAEESLLGALLLSRDVTAVEQAEAMRRVNPAFVLRNHLGEIAIRRAREGDFSEIETLLSLLSAPFDDRPGFETYAAPAPPWAQSIAISCSS